MVNNNSSISMNKTGKVLREIAGIDIYANKQQTQVKNMTDILDELHEKWNTLNDVQKKGLSEGIAGKTQASVFNSLMQNYDIYKQMMSEFSSGKQFNSALEENAKYIDSIQGRLASLKATWTGIATTVFNSDALKSGVSAFDGFSQGLAKVLTVLEKTHMTIPAAVASFALLKTAISSIKDAGGVSKALSSLWKNLNDFSKPSLAEKTFTSIATGAKKAMSALTALTGLSTGGLVLALGGVAAAMAGIYALSKWQDTQNMKATNTYNKLTKSVNEHKKALSEATNKESNLSSLYEQYQKLDKITNKNKEQQQQYNQVLQEMAKINPNLVSYDSNGSPIRARENEVRNLIKAYQDAIAEQKKLLANDLKDKANASYDKYNSQPEIQKRNDALKEAVDLSRKLEDNLGRNKLSDSGNLLSNYLKGYETSKEALKQYYEDLKEVKKAEQEAINVTVKQKNTLNADRSAVLENALGNVKDIENAGKARKQAIENALKFDFSEFDNSGFEKINSQLTDWLSKADYKEQIPQFNDIARAVEGINTAWSEGQLTAGQYTKQIESQAEALHKLTGISVEDAIKVLTSVEFDATEENKVFSDLEEFHNNIGEKIMQMGDKEVTAEQKLKIAYEIMQDPKTPDRIKEKVAEIVQDGEVTEQEVQTLIELQGEIIDGELDNTLNENLENLSKEEEITKEIAIKYAAYVQEGADFNQYMEELGLTKELAMNIKVDMDTGKLDNLKADLEGLPVEQQIGIIVAAASTGEYTPEQIQSFIETLPPEVQTAIRANDEASAIINNVKNNVNNVPESKNTNLNATDNTSSKANTAKNSILNIPKGWTSVFSATDNASATAGKVKGSIESIPKFWNIVISATQKVTKVISEVHKSLGGGRDNPGGSSVGEFTNISDTPVESNDVSATGTFSNISSTPTESSGASPVSGGASSAGGTSSGQVSSKATDILNGSSISTPKIDTSKTWESVKKGVDLFTELNERIDKVKSNLDVLGEKLERSVGKNRVSLLKQQNKLYEQQAKLTKELYNKTSKSQKEITEQAKKYGFTIKDGFLDNYEETLLKLEKAADDADKKLEEYNNKKSSSKSDSSKEDSKQKALEKAAEDAKTKLEEAKKAADAFFDQDKEMADCQKDWEELQNKIKETKDEIEQLEFEDKIYKQKNAIEELNQALETSNQNLDKYSTLADRYQGENKLKNLKLQTEELKKQIQYYKDMIVAGNAEIKQYQKKLKEYGVKFDKNNNISNYDEVLNKYQNSEDLDKIKDWIKEYQDLTENTRDWGNEIEDIINDTQDLNNEIKKIEFADKFKEFSNAVSDANQNMEKLNNELDILDVKLEYASGKDKIDLLDKQISKWEELIAQQKIALDNMKVQLNGTQNELSTYGFKFDDEGNIINKEDTLDSLKDNAMYHYIEEILEQWEDLYNDKIPSAEKELINYQNSIKDIRDEQLDAIKTVEDKLKDMYKKQLEDRIDQIEKEKDAQISAINEVKEQYNRQNDEDDYNKQYEEQQNVINELNKKIALAQRDTSLSG